MLEGLQALGDAHGLPVLLSTHPRTRKRVEDLDRAYPRINFHKPFGFHDYLALQVGARLVLSDSGTIAEEASLLDFKAVTLRDAIERPEAEDTGSIVLAGVTGRSIELAANYVLSTDAVTAPPSDYAIDTTSHRVLSAILSLVPTHASRTGIRA